MHGKDRTRDSRDADWAAGQRELYSFVNRIMYKPNNSTSVLLINISKMNPREYSFFHSLIFSLYKGPCPIDFTKLVNDDMIMEFS